MLLPHVRTRNDLPALLNALHLTGLGCEIGVAEGYFSWHLLSQWPGTLYLIDPWAILSEPGFSPHGEATQADQDARYKRILNRCASYNTHNRQRAIPLRQTSRDASFTFLDKTLDFIYIDANHSYPSIREDLALWYPKLKPGAVMSGHDYLEGTHGGQDYGVKRAVTEFAAARNLTVHSTLESDWPSWYIILP